MNHAEKSYRSQPLPETFFTPFLLIVGLCAYANSFSGVFVFDDLFHIIENAPLHSWHGLSQAVLSSERPLTMLTFWLNYAVGAEAVWGYHLVNLILHFACASLLYFIAKKAAQSDWLAAAAAVLWCAHPLQTQAVTYIIQRAEVLMAFCYLSSLACVIRASEDTGKRRTWQSWAIVFCALGMAAKPVMVTAPIVLLLYDRVFLSSSWRALWRRDFRLAWGLFFTWVLFAWLVLKNPTDTAGIVPGVPPLRYALTQPEVILHYLRLIIWPNPLVLDYGWPFIAHWQQAVIPGLILSGLLAGVIACWAYNAKLAFLGSSFFILLAPTSSIVPISDAAAEHRLYLPSAAVIVLLVSLARWLMKCFIDNGKQRSWAYGCSFTAALILLTGMTYSRNKTYQNAINLWRDTASKRPKNARAFNNLGRAFDAQGRMSEALECYEKAILLEPRFSQAHHNRAFVLQRKGLTRDAIDEYDAAIALNPRDGASHNDIAGLLLQQGEEPLALAHLLSAIRLSPNLPEAHSNIAIYFARQGRYAEAEEHLRKALAIRPNDPHMQIYLSWVLNEKARH